MNGRTICYLFLVITGSIYAFEDIPDISRSSDSQEEIPELLLAPSSTGSNNDITPGLLEKLAIDCYSYVLRIKFPHTVKHFPAICAYYKGKQLSFEKDFSIISEDKSCGSFSLFFTKPEHAPFPKCDGNNIRYLQRCDQKPCKFFALSRKNLPNTESWKITEKKADQLPLRLPDDAIILLIDPKLIQAIKENQELDKAPERIGNVNLVALPRIILKPDLDPDELQQDCDLAQLAACDLNAFHVPMKEKTQTKRLEKVTLSMPVHE